MPFEPLALIWSLFNILVSPTPNFFDTSIDFDSFIFFALGSAILIPTIRHESYGIVLIMAFTAPTGIPGVGAQLQEQMMKVYQWRMNTKLEAESKDNRLHIAEQTILSQNFELGQLRSQVNIK